MTLRLEDDWVWDSWPFDDDQGLHHLFFLKAPRSLGDPELRHVNASVGHAVSTDYRAWEILPDVLGPASGPAWDDGAIWTGSVVQGPSGTFHFFYTACSRADNFLVQRIGRADSTDLISWTRAGEQPLLEVDARWYEIHDGENWHDQAWRDPWVFADPEGDGWHMLITARSNSGAQFSRGVVGHAWSPDLDQWEVRPPLSQPGGFGQLEVMQLVPPGVIDSGAEAAVRVRRQGARHRHAPRWSTGRHVARDWPRGARSLGYRERPSHRPPDDLCGTRRHGRRWVTRGSRVRFRDRRRLRRFHP